MGELVDLATYRRERAEDARALKAMAIFQKLSRLQLEIARLESERERLRTSLAGCALTRIDGDDQPEPPTIA